MGLSEEKAYEYVCSLAYAVFRHQGEFVCLWHNTVLSSTDTTYHKRLYPLVLKYLARLLDSAGNLDGPAPEDHSSCAD
jgi:hypothetical protein